MNRVLSLVVFLLIFLLHSVFCVPVRHVNPEIIEEEPLGEGIILFYAGVFDYLILGNYSAVLNATKMFKYVYIPSRLRYVVNRTIELLKDISKYLNNCSKEIELAEKYIDVGDVAEARKHIYCAKMSLYKANRTLGEVREALLEFCRRGRFSFAIFSEKIDVLASKIVEFRSKINYIEYRIMFSRIPQKTFLTMFPYVYSVRVGSTLKIHGYLVAEEDGRLSYRMIRIYVNRSLVASVLTDDKGCYNVSISIPYVYGQFIEIKAVYNPVGEDKGKYTYSEVSRIVLLDYVKPELYVEVPSAVYPCSLLTVKGRVYVEGKPLTFHEIRVIFKGYCEYKCYTDNDGFFEIYWIVPGNVSKSVYVVVLSEAKGIIGPAKFVYKVIVLRLVPYIDVRYSPIVLSGLSIPFKVIAVFNENVVNGSYCVKAFNVKYIFNSSVFEVNVPWDIQTGHYIIEIKFKPDDPLYAESCVKVKIIVINSYTLFLGIVFLSLVLIKIRGFSRTFPAGERSEKLFIKRVVAKRRKVKLKGAILFYWKAVLLIEKITGFRMKRSFTMREYLEGVKTRIKDKKLFSLFYVLTLIAEEYLYGLRKMNRRALSIYRKVKRCMRGLK